MGEKRAYKARKPGGGRKKLKPEYDAGKNLKDQMDAAVALYEEDCSLQSIADVLNLNPIKVRKLLITAGVYESEVAEKVQDTFERYRKTQDYKISILSTATVLGLSKASVTSYLPYKKGVYFQSTEKEKISVGAERQRRYRAMKRWRANPTEENFWGVVVAYTLTIYSGYNVHRLKEDGYKVYTVKKELLDVGKQIVKSNQGNEIPMYDLERTICDLVRSRSSIEVQDFNAVLKAYVGRKDKDLNKLMKYAKLFRVDKIIRNYMEVLL